MDTKTVNLRDMPEDLIRRAKAYAALSGMSLKDFITQAIERALDEVETVPAMALFASSVTQKRRSGQKKRAGRKK